MPSRAAAAVRWKVAVIVVAYVVTDAASGLRIGAFLWSRHRIFPLRRKGSFRVFGRLGILRWIFISRSQVIASLRVNRSNYECLCLISYYLLTRERRIILHRRAIRLNKALSKDRSAGLQKYQAMGLFMTCLSRLDNVNERAVMFRSIVPTSEYFVLDPLLREGPGCPSGFLSNRQACPRSQEKRRNSRQRN